VQRLRGVHLDSEGSSPGGVGSGLVFNGGDSPAIVGEQSEGELFLVSFIATKVLEHRDFPVLHEKSEAHRNLPRPAGDASLTGKTLVEECAPFDALGKPPSRETPVCWSVYGGVWHSPGMVSNDDDQRLLEVGNPALSIPPLQGSGLGSGSRRGGATSPELFRGFLMVQTKRRAVESRSPVCHPALWPLPALSNCWPREWVKRGLGGFWRWMPLKKPQGPRSPHSCGEIQWIIQERDGDLSTDPGPPGGGAK